MADRILGGRYKVQDRIGTGGMAMVYRGLDEVLGRTVAIKTMLPQYASDPSFAARFKQEAQAAAALQSPYIVSVYDWGQDGDTYYIVMEYLRGTDLKNGIRRHGALDCKKVAQIGSQIAQALSVAHAHEIIHRDIKPQNIMVQPDGNIKVMDFGIARAKNSHLTQDNSVLGTAHYVSPEQTQGKELGPTTDIYSLGIVMYEAATGSVPFDGDDAISVALKQVNEQPEPPSKRNPKVDAALEGIILKCMQKDPADRFQTANELARVLRDYLAGRIRAVNSATASVAPAAVPMGQATAPLASNTSNMPRANTTARRMGTGRMKPQTATEKARKEEEERKRRHRRRLIIGAIVGALALVGIVAAIANAMGLFNQTRAVPNLSNLTEEQALAEIDGSGGFFQRGSVKEEYNSTVAQGLVIDQTPDAGQSAPRGTQIDLVISKGPEPAASVTVPDLTGMSAQEADAALKAVGLVGQPGDDVSDDKVDAGKVAAQNPAAGATAKAGDTVTYQLSKGPETTSVPSVVGMTQDQATKKLQDAGFTVTVKNADSDSVEKGKVISQSPSSGRAAKGSTVTITVSNGSSTVDVPDETGKDEEAAKQDLKSKGFSVTVQYEASKTVEKGKVISQSPSSGSAGKGSTVTITVSTGPSNSDNGGKGKSDGGNGPAPSDPTNGTDGASP
ncbi:serine/threonine-protein kinase [Olsenella profusa DSM 13989]|uniref:Stk1 family PASTA domain-containing Ser/Thr kinase n=1 Tax=Olsenella profusa TaxID=138595 RepID=UPI002784308A|nr:Stk1 family PASTA domain-containing Ser/Thr kinase [Olsenella profusa]MDP9858940.1 serine/threonine-protein kinase [Olsenella profusa DSM 13989]